MQLTLEDLKDALIYFSSTQSEGWKENCIVALESQNNKTGCILKLSGDFTEDVTVSWNSDFKRNGYKEKNKFIEKGAEALSFFIATEKTEYKIIEESTIGTGFDYWLGYNEDHEYYDEFNPFQARLEISGIGKETNGNKLQSRVAKKLIQTDPSDDLKLPAYISVVEFSTPKAYFCKK